MPGSIRNTVDRLDKPSAYYQGRVSCAIVIPLGAEGARLTIWSRIRSADMTEMERTRGENELQRNQQMIL